MRVDVLVACMESLDEAAAAAGRARARRVLLTPQGRAARPEQARAARRPHPSLMLVCGRYEGFDDRVRALVDEEISLGDFVLTGRRGRGHGGRRGVHPAPSGRARKRGVDARRVAQPRDARPPRVPAVHRARPSSAGTAVPEALVSGDHARIERWRRRAGVGADAASGAPRCSRATRTPCLAAARESAEAEHAASPRHRARAPPRAGRPPAPSSRPPSPTSTSTTSPAARGRTACSDYFIVHPITAQRELLARICEHWRDGAGGKRIPDRKLALELVRPATTLADALRRARRAERRSRSG